MRRSRPIDVDAVDHRGIERDAASWLSRRDGDTWTPANDAALADWLSRDTAHRVAFLRLQAAWAHAGRLKALGAGTHAMPPRGTWSAAESVDGDMQAHSPATLVFSPRTTPPRRRAWPVAAAAAIAVLALAGGWIWHGFVVVEAGSHATALGDVQTVSLADGSRTTLASDSRIDVRLSRRERRVDLHHGEAIFDAAKDTRRPFVVEAAGHQVVAVGTRFSVRRDGEALRVVVTEGVVRLEAAPGDGPPRPATLLPAGSIASARRDGVLVRTLPLAEAEQLLDWRSGLLVFRDTSLADAAMEFNRYNARKIVIGDDHVGDLRIGGSFRWENAEAFVRLLEQGFPVRAEYGRERIVLHSP
jgi:transmembrane sensor